MIEWSRTVGDRKEKIVIEDVISTIDASRSLVLKELSFNDSIKQNPRAKEIYERHRDVLEVLRARFQDMLDAPSKEPRKIIPKKRFHVVGGNK
jgi:hypothetical protein